MTITESSFLADVASHEITIIRDEGVYRHLRFSRPGTRCMQFDILTWPGFLCYTGDMGTYVFSRITDMLEFFRTDLDYARTKAAQLIINPRYWAEKLEAVDNPDGVTEFSDELFSEAVIEVLRGWIRDNAYRTTKEERRKLWEAVMREVLDASGDIGGYRKQCAAHDFSYFVNEKVGSFHFKDFGEYTVTDYTYRYRWCCYALTWGISQYDLAKASTYQEGVER